MADELEERSRRSFSGVIGKILDISLRPFFLICFPILVNILLFTLAYVPSGDLIIIVWVSMWGGEAFAFFIGVLLWTLWSKVIAGSRLTGRHEAAIALVDEEDLERDSSREEARGTSHRIRNVLSSSQFRSKHKLSSSCPLLLVDSWCYVQRAWLSLRCLLLFRSSSTLAYTSLTASPLETVATLTSVCGSYFGLVRF